jgi:hypothetical protein
VVQATVLLRWGRLLLGVIPFLLVAALEVATRIIVVVQTPRLFIPVVALERAKVVLEVTAEMDLLAPLMDHPQ